MPELPSMKVSMKCPHCLEFFNETWREQELGIDKFSVWKIRGAKCPACEEYIFLLRRSIPEAQEVIDIMVWPKTPARTKLAPVVPAEFADDYREAAVVIADSPKASAALSRRCLQHLLREVAAVKPGDLADEIQQVLDSNSLPSHLAKAVDAVRIIGNFAAHPIKSKKTSEIIDVEAGEAEWLLDTLEGLFDFYFVQPSILQQKQDALDEKLSKAGKRPIK